MRRVVTQVLAAAMTLVALLVPNASQAATAGDHVMYIDGTSTITGYCQYVWKTPVERDELGIPKPSMLPPTCQTDNPATPRNEARCTLQRNLGPYPPNGSPNPVTGEVGLNPPCAGQISASTDTTPGSCLDATNGDTTCRINAPTWFYGYCGQTYGGAIGGSLKFQGQTWTIDRMGFPRGRGAWEFSGKISHSTGGTSKIRFYFAAAPNKPEESAACDTGGNLSQITFNGIAIVGTRLPVRVIRTKPGWHFCADDPVLGLPGNEGC